MRREPLPGVPSEPDKEAFFSGLSAEEAMQGLPQSPDWETLMEEGVQPSLPLGAERRLNR